MRCWPTWAKRAAATPPRPRHPTRVGGSAPGRRPGRGPTWPPGIYWQQADTLALYLTVPRAVARPLQRLLPEIWPDAVLEPVAALPPPPEALGSLQVRGGRRVGQGGADDPLDFAAAGLPALACWAH